MPIRVRWYQGKYLAIALMFFGLAGLFQTIFIAHGQYIAGVGSLYAVTTMPVVVTLCIGYGALIIFEAQLQRQRKSQFRKGFKKLGPKKIWQNDFFLPVFLPLVFFAGIYLAVFFVAMVWQPALTSFMIAENTGAIGVLVICSLVESKIAPNVKRY